MKLVSRRAASQDYYKATFPLLAATLFSHLAFEAFLNDIGSRLLPYIWTKERTFFSQGDFRGELGKLSFLLQEGGLSFPEGARPLATLATLVDRRNWLVHGGTELIDTLLEYHNPEELEKRPAPHLYELTDAVF